MATVAGYKFYQQNDKYALESLTNGQVIVFHRDAGSIELSDKLPTFNTPPEVIDVYGMLGMQRLLSGDVLMLITSAAFVGTLLGKSIYKVNQTELFPMARNHCYLTLEQANDEERFVGLLKNFLKTAPFYFSKELDLSNNVQFNIQNKMDIAKVNPMFCWNHQHMQPFLDVTKEDETQNFSHFLMPIISGFASINQVQIEEHTLTYSLISRRSWYRVGTRFFSRGLDSLGNVSNYVETEQVIEVPDLEGGMDILSFIQVRGSIPLFWAQVTNTKYTPNLVVDNRKETIEVMKKHFDKMVSDYKGEILVVNLINQKGYELKIFNELSDKIKLLNNKDVIHVPFDFHKECSKMRWDRIDLLTQQLLPNLEKQGFFHYSTTQNKVLRQQKGVIRSNCMDCLDRTNVVQSIFAKTMLTQKLQSLPKFQKEIINYSNQFNNLFNNLWADHADAISIFYSGTGALKTDFTRTGKRTKIGALMDGYNSCVRYIKNNYLDGGRQDAIDLFLLKYHPNSSSPFNTNLNSTVYVALSLVASSLGLFSFNFWLGSNSWYYHFLAISCAIMAIVLFKSNAAAFVDRPKLVLYEYDGIVTDKPEKAQDILLEKGTLVPNAEVKGKFD